MLKKLFDSDQKIGTVLSKVNTSINQNKKYYMRTAGIIIMIIGLIGVVVFGIQAFNDSESFNLFGMDIAVSTANWTPLILSSLVTIVGIIMASVKKTS